MTKWEVDENDLGIVVKEGNDWVVRTTRTWGDPEGICVRKNISVLPPLLFPFHVYVLICFLSSSKTYLSYHTIYNKQSLLHSCRPFFFLFFHIYIYICDLCLVI